MKKTIQLLTLACTILLFSGGALAGCSLITNKFGQTSVMCDDGTMGSLITDRNGNTSGIIRGQLYNSRTDKFGNTSGSFGGNLFNSYTDRNGNTSGMIGGQNQNGYSNPYGDTSDISRGGLYTCRNNGNGYTRCD